MLAFLASLAFLAFFILQSPHYVLAQFYFDDQSPLNFSASSVKVNRV